MIKNSILSLKKNLGKTILLLVIMTVIANLIIAGLSIQSGSEKSMEQIKESLGNDVTLSYNVTNMMQGNRNPESGQSEGDQSEPLEMPEITIDAATSLTTLNHVESYNFTKSVSVESDDITAVEIEQSGGRGPIMQTGLTLLGNTTMENEESFLDGTYSLLEGRVLTSDDIDTNNVVIETNLAINNDIALGDTINVTTSTGDYELNVVGIYEVLSSGDYQSFTSGNSLNTIYGDYSYVSTISDSVGYVDSAVYYLDSPENMDAFIEEATALGTIDLETFSLSANDRLYEMNVQSLENSESFANMFLIVVIIAGSAILCLILILTIRSRFYEIGVFLSLGQSKIKIIGQQLLEVAIIASIAIVISLGTGSVVSNIVSDMLISGETQTNSMMGDRPNNMMGEQTQMQSESTDLDVSLTTTTVIQLVVISGAICIVSIVIPSSYILRRTPREILSKKEG